MRVPFGSFEASGASVDTTARATVLAGINRRQAKRGCIVAMKVDIATFRVTLNKTRSSLYAQIGAHLERTAIL